MDDEIRQLVGQLRRADRIHDQRAGDLLEIVTAELGPKDTKARRSFLLSVMREALVRYMRTFRDDPCCAARGCGHPSAWHQRTPMGTFECRPPASMIMVAARGGLVFRRGMACNCTAEGSASAAAPRAEDFAEPVHGILPSVAPGTLEIPAAREEPATAALLEHAGASSMEELAVAEAVQVPHPDDHQLERWAWEPKLKCWERGCTQCAFAESRITCPRCRKDRTSGGIRRCKCVPTVHVRDKVGA